MPDVIDDGSTPTPETLSQAGAKGMANSIAVHTVPSLRHVLTQAVAASKGLGGSVLNAASTKVLLVVPEEGKLKMWDVWGKAKEGRRHSSFMDKNTIR
jgi:cell division cycle protein 20 (cofactor of APC complex)